MRNIDREGNGLKERDRERERETQRVRVKVAKAVWEVERKARGQPEGGEVERVLPRGRERVSSTREIHRGATAKGRGTTARGFRNQGCLMPKWTLFAR